eukprot:TRINITY_DN13263_c0_g2_i2.p1 TRINITY_DN13263_c0_g2~~TRINITY_DN13263_c0_g2_i2.p1  ORF type:complete len:182 (+),score=4.87 TRINITY_DN13263_c0_g2_i2:60-548(+)
MCIRDRYDRVNSLPKKILIIPNSFRQYILKVLLSNNSLSQGPKGTLSFSSFTNSYLSSTKLLQCSRRWEKVSLYEETCQRSCDLAATNRPTYMCSMHDNIERQNAYCQSKFSCRFNLSPPRSPAAEDSRMSLFSSRPISMMVGYLQNISAAHNVQITIGDMR